MISKGTIRYIKSLQLKKYRNKAQSFLIEGTKSVLELINAGIEVTYLIGTESFLKHNERTIAKLNLPFELVGSRQLSSMSSLKTNQEVLAVARYFSNHPKNIPTHKFVIAMDRINDPGNLGTIIRTADWYGISHVVCSRECADFYNPKVIQATMGSFTRVKVYYLDLREFLPGRTVYGARMNGHNVHQIKFDRAGVLLIGSESHGISDDLNPLVSTWIGIPGYGGAESLNAAIATAVICDNLRRSS